MLSRVDVAVQQPQVQRATGTCADELYDHRASQAVLQRQYSRYCCCGAGALYMPDAGAGDSEPAGVEPDGKVYIHHSTLHCYWQRRGLQVRKVRRPYLCSEISRVHLLSTQTGGLALLVQERAGHRAGGRWHTWQAAPVDEQAATAGTQPEDPGV